MASTSALRPAAQGHHAPALQLQPSEWRGRSKSRNRRLPSLSLALAPGDMGSNTSKSVLPALRTVGPQVPDIQQPQHSAAAGSTQGHSGSLPTPIATAYGNKDVAPSRGMGSICRSPTWSPRGSLAARNQADKDRRDRERALRKEAEEAKRRLKEFKEQGRRNTEPSIVPVNSIEPSGPNKLQKRRFSKQPPPAAMETQRLPTALRTSQEHSQSGQSLPDQEKQQKRRSRSSSLSSMLRMVTRRSSSTSGSRRGSIGDDDVYMSDSSTNSKSSFIGGVKLRRQQKPVIEFSAIGKRSPNDSGSFVKDMNAQIDEIAGRSAREPENTKVSGSSVRNSTDHSNITGSQTQNRETEAPSEAGEVNANTGRRRSQKLDADTKLESQTPLEAEDGKKRHSLTEQLKASREASLNRLQNLVTPLRSAMKGSREIAKGGRTQSMPAKQGQTATSPTAQTATPQSSTNYVHRSRMHSQTRSMAGWQDEMAVREANELAAASATTEAQDAPVQPSYGGHMPPTPEESVDDSMTPRASHDTVGRGAPAENLASVSRSDTRLVPGFTERITWKQSIKANKSAAEQRAGASGEEHRKSSDIDKLPSQNRSRLASDSPALRPAGADVPEHAHELSSPTSPILSDDENHGLRRHPAVMSWKADKDHQKYPSLPRAATMPVIPGEPASPGPTPAAIERTLGPEAHPSLAALRSLAQPELDASTLPDYSDPVDRPFSIVPTPVASPRPTTNSSQKSAKPVKSNRSLKTKRAASQAIEKLREEQAEKAKQAEQAARASEEKVLSHEMPASLKPSYRRHSTPPGELVPKSATATTFPFPDRHEAFVRPAQAAKSSGSSNKVTFHTPPESPRFLTVPTSYDSYRRGVDAGHSSSDLDDDITLPIPASKLTRTDGLASTTQVPSLPVPNPPFAREGRKTPSPNATPRNGRSPAAHTRVRSTDGKGYVYVNFSPVGSTSTLNVSEDGASGSALGKKMPKGFIIKNADGAAIDPVAKLFVICCGCKKWHDVPSNIYREMARGVEETDLKRDRLAGARSLAHANGVEKQDGKTPRSKDGALEDSKEWAQMGEKERARARNVAEKRKAKAAAGRATSTVSCCWCRHEMNVLCCEGWSTLCYKSAQYHAKGAERGIEKEEGRVISDV